MAKVYNPYEDPTLVKRQEQMHNSGLGAFIKPVQQGADAFAGAMENSPVAAPMRRVMADNAAQKTMIATDQNRKERTALGAEFPEGREVFSNNRGMVSNMGPARSAEIVTEARGLRNPVAQAAGMTPTASVNAPVVAGGMMPTSGEGANNPTPVLNAAQGQLPGNTGQVPATQPAAGAGLGFNLSERDKAIKASLAAVDNEVARMGQEGIPVSPQQAEQIANLKQQAGFLRGGTDRVPVGPDGRQIRPGGAGLSGSNYSFQGSPEAAKIFNSAVSPREYSPEANAARNMATKQYNENLFRETNGKYGTNPTPMTEVEKTIGSRLNKFSKDQQPELIKAALGGIASKDANTVAKGTLANQARTTDTQIAGAGLDQAGKRMTIDEQKRIQGLQKAYNEAKTPAEKASAEKALIASGVMKRDKPEVFFDEERDQMGNVTRKTPYILENGVVRPAVGGAGMGEKYNFTDASPENKAKFAALKKNNPQEYERLRQQFLSQSQ